jgi:hypothetical protein
MNDQAHDSHVRSYLGVVVNPGETTLMLRRLLEDLDLQVIDGIYAMDLALDEHNELELAKATARYTAAKAGYDAFRRLFPYVTC